jgi:hypothetical protein
VVLICVLEATVKVAAVPLKRTLVAPVKFVPVIVTAVPTGPLVGANDVIVGAAGAVTVKSPALVAVPPGVVTPIFPVVAPAGTVALICVLDTTVKLVAVRLRRTLVAPLKFVPVTATAVPTGPLVERTMRSSVPGRPEVTRSRRQVPLGVVTLIAPSWRRRGPCVERAGAEATVKVAAVPLRARCARRWSARSPRTSPPGPLVGVKDVIEGAPDGTRSGNCAGRSVLVARQRTQFINCFSRVLLGRGGVVE